jgi:hypothetical protein
MSTTLVAVTSGLPKNRLLATIYNCECAKKVRAPRWFFNLQRLGEVEVVGESLYQDNIGAALGHVHMVGMKVDVVLVPEPENFHDRFAVRIDILSGGRQFKAGYIPRYEAKKYHRQLLPFAQDGLYGLTKAKVWRGNSGYQLYLHLAEPEWVLPREAPVPDGVVFVAERATTVTGEEHFQPALKTVMGRRRKALEHTFRLAIGAMPSGTNRGLPVIDVYSGEYQVGRLTVGKSFEYSDPMVLAVARGLVSHAIGYVKEEERRGLQVTLYLPISKYCNRAEDYFYRDVSGTDGLS